MSYTDREYWDEYWEAEKRGGESFYFSELLDRFIPWHHVKTYMEIGGAPGTILAYMYNEHALKVSTIDFTDERRIRDYLKDSHVDDYEIVNDDFSKIDIEMFRGKYDIVASWGFVEHFEREVTSDFIEKQKDMVAEDGYLVIELPNIRKLFWLTYWLFNRKLIKIHNLDIMDLPWLTQQVLYGGQFELLYASYYFAMNVENEYFIEHPHVSKICQNIVRFFRNRNFRNDVRKWFYPYIVIIAKRKSKYGKVANYEEG